MTTAYSETPLAKKLGIKADHKLLLHNPPSYYFMLFSDLPEGVSLVENELENEIDFVHLFCTDFEELKKVFVAHKWRIAKNGMISDSLASAALVSGIKSSEKIFEKYNIKAAFFISQEDGVKKLSKYTGLQ